jgi:poly(A) polymerase
VLSGGASPGGGPAAGRQDKGQPEGVRGILLSRGHTARLRGFSAIDRYLDWDSLPFVLVDTSAPLSELARLFENLRFPGVTLADAAVTFQGRDYLFRCPDSGVTPGSAYKILRFFQDWDTGRFYDPCGFYPLFRRIRGAGRIEAKSAASGNGILTGEVPSWREGFESSEHWLRAVMEGALIAARYAFHESCYLCAAINGPGPAEEPLYDSRGQEMRQREITALAAAMGELPDAGPPNQEEQRLLLLGLLDSPHPEFGFELLKAAGFVEDYWPELALLDDVDHSKEFHPEGNVWKHTMETFRYRKSGRNGAGYDIRLSLSLLLHDSGKPLAESSGGHRFQAHAELGAREARRFLDRLGFSRALIDDVAWLVKNHMLPAAMPRLPLVRTQEIMEAHLFPTLMELYRCDESSSFKGLDGYYESSAAYRQYLKYRRNPYRTADGKKIGKRFL